MNRFEKISDLFFVTDYVANGSFASLKENVTYKNEPDFAILLRLTDNTKKWNGNYVYVDEKSFNFLSKSKVIPGDLVISNVGEPGIAFIAPDLGKPMTLGPNSILVRPLKNDIDVNYFFYLIKSPAGQKEIKKIVSKTTIRKFNKTDFRNITFHLPPLSDQIRIAEILSQAESLIAQRKQSISLLDELLKSTFLEMFGDPVRNPNKWTIKKLKDVCIKITDGTHFSPPIVEEGIPYITAKHVRENKIDFWAKPWFISEEHHKEIYKRCTPVKGDVLYIKDGATTGYAAINKYDFEFSMLSSLALLKVDYKILNSEYLCSWLNNEIVKVKILEGMSGGAIQRLTLTKINQLPINVPPLKLQTKFANIVEKVEAHKSQYQQSLTELQNMYGVLSQKAFKGELNIKEVKIANL